MTQEALERGERLTINNANKAQLKWMVKERDYQIDRLLEKLERKQQEIDNWQRFTEGLLNTWQEILAKQVNPIEVKKEQ